jgi:DNA-binding PadR family transcriptional regulator
MHHHHFGRGGHGPWGERSEGFGPFGHPGRERSREGQGQGPPRGAFGPGGPWGGFGPGGPRWGFGPGGPWGQRVDRGEVKYLILSILEAGPKHGYEIMRAMEERTQGAYVPSAGTIYPTLQLLEDMGHVQGREAEGRKVYTLTDAGRAYLTEHQEDARRAWGRFQERGGQGDERRQLRDELGGLARALFAEGRIFRADAATLTRVRDILKNARQQIDSVLGGYV